MSEEDPIIRLLDAVRAKQHVRLLDDGTALAIVIPIEEYEALMEVAKS